MAELFKGKPGAFFELKGDKPEQLHAQAEHLLLKDPFLCFGLHRNTGLAPVASQLVAGIGGLDLPLDRHLTADAGGEVQTVLGMDVIKGKSRPAPGGTSYERPVAANAKNPASPDLADKNFAYVPLGGTITISTSPEHTLEVDPGQGFLAVEGQEHSVHIPSGLIAVEFVLAPGTDHTQSEWHRYVHAQPNPNA